MFIYLIVFTINILLSSQEEFPEILGEILDNKPLLSPQQKPNATSSKSTISGLNLAQTSTSGPETAEPGSDSKSGLPPISGFMAIALQREREKEKEGHNLRRRSSTSIEHKVLVKKWRGQRYKKWEISMGIMPQVSDKL